MKNKKGFTLVELLAVIVILGIIMTIAVPNVISSINASKEKKKEIAAQEIVNIAEAYFSENIDKTFVNVNTLINDGYLESDVTNPRTGKAFESSEQQKVGIYKSKYFSTIATSTDTYKYYDGYALGMSVYDLSDTFEDSENPEISFVNYVNKIKDTDTGTSSVGKYKKNIKENGFVHCTGEVTREIIATYNYKNSIDNDKLTKLAKKINFYISADANYTDDNSKISLVKCLKYDDASKNYTTIKPIDSKIKE